MKRALLIGAEELDPEHAFRPGPSLSAMQSLLEDLGGWTISRLDDRAASRDGMLAALDQLARDVEPEDACLFYFVGHGGVVELMDVPPPLGRRPVFYICAARADEPWSLDGVLDFELSLALGRIDRACGNVTAIIDSCFSARVVRGPVYTIYRSPAWVHEVAARGSDRDVDELLSATGHPRIVRLTAASSLRKAYVEDRADGHIARLTRLFTEVVRDAELRLDRLTWDALAHRVRERAIWRLGCEEQWVSLLGPRQRLMFSRDEVELPRTVGFVPREDAPGGWIRAGALQGVHVGDEWGVAELALDDELRPRLLGRFRVTEVDLNRATLEPVSGADTAPPGASATLLRASDGASVIVDGPPEAVAAVTGSAWLVPRPADDAIGVLRVEEGSIELVAPDDAHAPGRFPASEAGLAAAIDRLEDWARARRISTVVHSQRSNPLTSILEVRLGRYETRHGARLPRVLSIGSQIPTLTVGERIFVELSHMSEVAQWFVSVVEIDVAGRPRLLDESEPDGRELLDGETAIIGEHPHRDLQGIELRWPEGVAPDRPRLVTIIVFASRRPIQLGHLVRSPSGERRVPRDVPPRCRAVVRGRLDHPRPRTGPELAHWGATVIRYQLAPSEPEPK